jgi:two-component system response regulator
MTIEKPEIILIEDNPGDVALVMLALKEKNIEYVLTHYRSGIDAVDALGGRSAETKPPRAILLDLNTPKTDGFTALAKLMQMPRLAHVPIAVLTSSRAQSDKHRAAIHGARYIEKPSQLREFLSSVGNAVKEMLASAA